MAGSAGRFRGFVRLVNAGFVIERNFRVLFENLVVAGLAVIFQALDVGRVIERHVAVLGGERHLVGSFFLLSKQPKGANQGEGEETRDKGSHCDTLPLHTNGF